VFSNIWYIRQPGSLQIVNLPATAWHIAAQLFGSLVFLQLGSFAAHRQIYSSAAWQLGSFEN
jgi:hypothetical protein